MNVPVVRMCYAAATDVTYGLGAQLTALTPDGSDVIPEVPTIINATNDDSAVFTNSPGAVANQNWPLLVITAEQPAKLVMTGVVGRAFDAPNFQVMMLYITRQKLSPSKAWCDTDYTLRALAIALDRKLFGSDQAASRVRGKVMIVKQNSLEYGPTDYEIKAGRIAGYLLLDLYIRVQP